MFVLFPETKVILKNILVVVVAFIDAFLKFGKLVFYVFQLIL
jgi:hypothetical protein